MTRPARITPSWLRIEAHAAARIEALRDSLETAAAENITQLQAEVRVWRQIIDLPLTLSDEQIQPDEAGYA